MHVITLTETSLTWVFDSSLQLVSPLSDKGDTRTAFNDARQSAAALADRMWQDGNTSGRARFAGGPNVNKAIYNDIRVHDGSFNFWLRPK
jgi:hypothetical protein